MLELEEGPVPFAPKARRMDLRSLQQPAWMQVFPDGGLCRFLVGVCVGSLVGVCVGSLVGVCVGSWWGSVLVPGGGFRLVCLWFVSFLQLLFQAFYFCGVRKP